MRVERLQSEFDIQIKLTHFPLHPDTPDEGLTLEQLFAGRNIDIPAAKARMKQLMADEGLPYGERTMTYNSRGAQEFAVWAEEQRGGEGIHKALYTAYFVDGLNIAADDNLLHIACQLGLSEDDSRQALLSRPGRERVDEDWHRSRTLGVNGVPTFAAGKQGIVGAQSYEALRKLLVDAGASV